MELTHKNLSLKELAQLALVEIYRDYQKNKGQEATSMGEIRNRLGLVEFDDRIFQIKDLLEQMGYINIENTFSDGLSFVKLTPKAILYLEETNDTSLNNTGNRRDNIVYNFFSKVEKSQFNSNSSYITQINNDTNPDILDKIIEVVKSSNEISTSDKNDLLSDIAIIKNEVTKSKPDKTLIEKRIEVWSKFIPLIPLLPAAQEWLKSIL